MPNVVITGGSRGIGAAAVELFSQQGNTVYFLYEKEHEKAAAIAEKTGATAICCDVADGAAVRAVFEKLPDVDVLICNAGICHTGLMQDMQEDQWDRLFAVNVKGIGEKTALIICDTNGVNTKARDSQSYENEIVKGLLESSLLPSKYADFSAPVSIIDNFSKAHQTINID